MPTYDYICPKDDKGCGKIIRDVKKPMSESTNHKCTKCGKKMIRAYDQSNIMIIGPTVTLGFWMESKKAKSKRKTKEEIRGMIKQKEGDDV